MFEQPVAVEVEEGVENKLDTGSSWSSSTW